MTQDTPGLDSDTQRNVHVHFIMNMVNWSLISMTHTCIYKQYNPDQKVYQCCSEPVFNLQKLASDFPSLI